MTEDFLHYVWKFQKFSTTALRTTNDELINVERVGEHNLNSGPDFFNAQLLISNQLWAGNVEIHLKSSDWYSHHHENDPAYDNVILHVVWEYDAEVFRKDNTTIPTLILKSITDLKLLDNYRKILLREEDWIPCEKSFAKVDDFIFNNWLERLYIERLKQKSILIEDELKKSNNHWESVLFKLLCKNFGLKVNGESFYSIANSIDYEILLKINEEVNFEALLFGQAGLLDADLENTYFKKMNKKYAFLKHKYQLDNSQVITSKYFRLRPPNFPTIRLSQFAVLYTERQSLFSKILQIKTMEDYYNLFAISASYYWDTHYNFGITSFKKQKKLTKPFIDLLLVNTIIPVLFSYGKFIGKDNTEELLQLATRITTEKNNIIKKFNELRPSPKNGMHSQALLQLKNKYCDQKKCLQCAVGNSILNY